ncbi:Golgi reassembly-stacking protein 2 [Halotydeus destructor]|nr:Golgi reassembly-stacking protein 2 [Halotydeus destructor]
MGASQSVEIPGGGTEGYHVLKVQENSPGGRAGLQAYFDFIVAIGNTRLNQDNDALKEILKACADRPTRMTVYNSKSQNVRDVEIIPSNHWGGQGLLGVSIRFCSFDGANEHVWHILDVEPSSPAEKAGLQSNCDYVIGADSVLQESDDLFTLIEAHENKPLKLFVYNYITDSCREVTIIPSTTWGGEGMLGCGIGYGYLHRIPTRPTDEVQPEASSLLPTEAPKPREATVQPSGYSAAAVASLADSLATAQVSGPTAPVEATVPQVTKDPVPAPQTFEQPAQSVAPNTNVFSLPNNPPEGVREMPPMLPPTFMPRSPMMSSQVPMAPAFSNPSFKMPTLPSSSAYPTSSAPPMAAFNQYDPLAGLQSQPGAMPQLFQPPPMSSFTTPISLPGMPPLTVSATMPEAINFSHQSYPVQPPVQLTSNFTPYNPSLK